MNSLEEVTKKVKEKIKPITEKYLNDIADWHKQSLIDFIENEIGRLRMIKESKRFDAREIGNYTDSYRYGYQDCLDDQIDHLLSVIKEIKN